MDTWPSPEEQAANQKELLDILARDMMETGVNIPLDAITSKQTMDLVKAFGATGVDMTILWAMTPQNWRCGSCGRTKKQIVRLNKNKNLMCRLVEHHDHMQQLLEKRFEDISSGLEKKVANDSSVQFAERAAAMVSAFDNTVICDDCNVADVSAKKSANADPAFSFSPAELSRIVSARDNEAHGINEEVARTIWECNKETFRLRLRIVDQIARIAATNSHWFQPTRDMNRAERVQSFADGILARRRTGGQYTFLTGEKRNVASEDIAKWRKTIYPVYRGSLSDGSVEHVAAVKCAKVWSSLAEDWKCPGCDRSKRDTIKNTSKNGLSFSLYHRWYWDSTPPKYMVRQSLCSDCGWVSEQLGLEARKSVNASKGRNSALIGIDEIRQIVIARSHSRHNLNNERVDTILNEIVQRIEFVDLLATSTPGDVDDDDEGIQYL